MKDKHDQHTMDMFEFGKYAAQTICKDLPSVGADITMDNILEEVDNNWRGYMSEDIGELE